MIDVRKHNVQYSNDFRFERLNNNTFNVINLNDGSRTVILQSVFQDADKILTTLSLEPITDDLMLQAFESYRYSPQYKVGTHVTVEGTPLEALKTVYETLIAGAVAELMASKNNTNIDRIAAHVGRICSWLDESDFYISPASTVYHGSFVGGLLVHSLEVYNQIIVLKQLPQFKDISMASAAFVALVHDWCKIGLYESYDKNVKNPETNQWEQVKAFRRNQTGVPLGHGATSMFLAQRLFPSLGVDEALAIRWHQGEYNVCKDELNELHLSNQKYPLVYLIQFADRLACTSYANSNY